MATLKSLSSKHILFSTLLVCFQIIEANSQIKYQLELATSGYVYEANILNKEVITSVEKAFTVRVLSDVPVLLKGMLEITPETYYFCLQRHNLEKIEVGAFDNQNITRQILLDGNKLTVVASGTFKNLKIKKLNLADNQITHVEENAITNLPNLVEVHLSQNKIVKFHDNSFVKTPNMAVLNMFQNELGELGERWFSFMTKEKPVTRRFGDNNIGKIHPKAFDGISVSYMELSGNKLSQVPGEIFTKCVLFDAEQQHIRRSTGFFFPAEKFEKPGY
ncbi:hypothetical protein Zmor_022980 [Zophobas morio]|uniref:Leucine-rich repeat domain-containing protein n=1 Tax=Zophobas morio TaxID=2755281 RepID=A0AA38I236_9CUCU|nr:hypothetical protein Zmor_022980 [Zophobas morio]